MRLIVDGIVYGRQKHGGINTWYNQVMPRLVTLCGVDVNILLPRNCLGEVPSRPARVLRRDFIPNDTGISWRLDQHLKTANFRAIGLWARTKRQTVFQSTYFTWLPTSVPHVAVALDMNHELLAEHYTTPFLAWLREIYPEYLFRSDRIIAISETTKQNLMRFYRINESKIRVVPLATDPLVFFIDRDASSLAMLQETMDVSPPYLLYVGARNTTYKNFFRVLEAVSQVRREVPLSLVVAGPKWQDAEIASIRSLSMSEAVRLVEDPSDAALRLLYNFAHAFIYPSCSEGFGIPLLEAMACGTPILCSSIPAFREVAADAPVYFDPSDTPHMIKAVETSFDHTTRQTCITRGVQRAAQFSWDKCAAGMYAVYQEALG